MSRAERWGAAARLALAGVVGVALGGCMRIYPDPELPDIRLEWFSGDEECAAGTDRVVASLTAIDAPDPSAEVAAVTAPCTEGTARFVDVERVRYRVTLRLEDDAGDVYGGHTEEIDLRDGLNERVFAYFGRSTEPNLRVAWAFDMGDSCASLATPQLVMRLAREGGPTYFLYAPCDVPVLVETAPEDGAYTFVAQAITAQGVVRAASPATAPFTIVRGQVVDLGTVTLSRCSGDCPAMEPAVADL